MQHDVIIAGFGGQGVMLMGRILAYAGMREGLEVSWLPSYGPEMRGGTANCTVVLSDRPVGSPVVEFPRSLLVMNLPSLDKFEPNLKPGGLLLINSSLIPRRSRREDVRVFYVPANDVANELGNPRAANMVALGAYVAACGVPSLDGVAEVVRETFAKKKDVADKNVQAFRRGAQIVAASGSVEVNATR